MDGIIIYVLYKFKSPIIAFIYSMDYSYTINILLALSVSILISREINKFYSHLKKTVFFNYYFNSYLLDDLITWFAVLENLLGYFCNFVTNNPYHTMPKLSEEMKQGLNLRRRVLEHKAKSVGTQLRKLESLASAIDRNRSHHTHGSLYDVFKENGRDSKKELNALYYEYLDITKTLKRKNNPSIL